LIAEPTEHALETVRHHSLNRNGRRLHLLEWPAEGPPIVCLHHNWGTADVWADLPAALGGRYRVLSLDSPGYGESEVANPEDPAGDLSAVVEELVGEPAILVGASAGGLRAGIFAQERPDLVRRLVLIEPPVQTEYMAQISERSQRAGRGEITGGGSPPRTLDELFAAQQPRYANVRPEILRTYLARTHHPVDGVWRPRVTTTTSATMGARPGFLQSNLERLTMPVLILYAARSRLCGPEGGRRIQAAIPGSVLVEVPDAGHLVLLYQPEFVYDRIGRFSAPDRATPR
jgi:pimeloyl-ACP methyl ester carboxylesterase